MTKGTLFYGKRYVKTWNKILKVRYFVAIFRKSTLIYGSFENLIIFWIPF